MGFATVWRSIFLVIALSAFAAGGGQAEDGQEPRISPFSGKPVPRFESLRFSEVNGRQGPSVDHPIMWTYERAGLPVLILKESPDWRRVRDPSGAEVWMHARTLSSAATGMARREMTVHQSADEGSNPVAILQTGAIVDVIDEQAGWVHVRNKVFEGWVKAESFWGGALPSDSGPGTHTG